MSISFCVCAPEIKKSSVLLKARFSELLCCNIQSPAYINEVLTNGSSDLHCKIKETLLRRDLKPALSENVGSENCGFINR